METAAPSADTGASNAAPETFSGVAAAAQFLSAKREREANPAAEAANDTTSDDGAETATADEQELPGEGNADPATDPGETQEAEADTDPPIERPKSWSKDEDAEWRSLPRAMQEKIRSRELERDKGITRSQQEAAEARKAAQAEATKAEQARETFEQKARDALSILSREQQRDYADIKTVEDVTKLAQTDPLRFIQWQAHQAELAATKQAVDEADRRKADDDANQWKSFRQKENALAIEHIPDLGDKAKAPKLMEKAVSLLQDVGFTAQELGKFDNGEKLSLFDHRVQRLIFDATRFRDMQAAKTAAVTKAVPAVQRPGARQPAASGASQRVDALTTKFNNSGNLKDAAALLAARRASQRRSA